MYRLDFFSFFFFASVNPVMVKWRWLVLRASISHVFTLFLPRQHKTLSHQENMQNQSPRLSLSLSSSPSYLQAFCPKFSLPTYNHLHTRHHYNHFIHPQRTSICFKSVTHPRDRNIFMPFGSGVGCWQVLSIWSWWLSIFTCRNPMTAIRHLSLSWMAPVSLASSPGALTVLMDVFTEGDRAWKKTESVNRVFLLWVILHPVCRALCRVIHLAQKSQTLRGQWSCLDSAAFKGQCSTSDTFLLMK